MKVFARERYYVPYNELSESDAKALVKRYTYHFFEDKACANCEWVGLRKKEELLGECETCAAYLGSTILSSRVKVGSKPYLTTPLGDRAGLISFLKSRGYSGTIKSLHPIIPIKPIKFTGKLRDYQEKAVEACIQNKIGVLSAPPRSGKTLVATAIICRLSVKALIIASQRDWLMGFYETFVGSPTQQGFTNIDKSRIGFCKKLEDFKKYDVCLATVQTFHSDKGQKLLRLLRDTFEIVVIDEVHTSSANKYIQEVSLFNCNYKIGLTGTPDRKDGRYPLTAAVVGPVVHEVQIERLRPEIKLVRTGFNNGSKSTVWAYIVKRLESDKTRLKLIADWAIRDVEAGHIIAIPFAQTKPIFELVKLINEKAGKEIAKSFVGTMKKADRDQLIQDVRKRKVKVLVGTAKLLSVGINIPVLSCLYEQLLSQNLPNCQQRLSRILTPCEGKPQPIIRYFLDDVQVRRSCLAPEFWNVAIKEIKAMISEKDMQAMKTYLSQKDYYRGWQ